MILPLDDQQRFSCLFHEDTFQIVDKESVFQQLYIELILLEIDWTNVFDHQYFLYL